MPTPHNDPRFVYSPRICRPERGGRGGLIWFQKKRWRRVVGLLLPIRCPRCKVPTRQIDTKQVKRGQTVRQCIGCRAHFTLRDAKRGLYSVPV